MKYIVNNLVIMELELDEMLAIKLMGYSVEKM
jgi:hypothetical protein